MKSLFNDWSGTLTTDQTREQPVPDDGMKAWNQTLERMILDQLLQHPDGVTTTALKLITHRFSSSIQTLRNKGHVIEKTREGNGEFRYRRTGYRVMLPTGDGLQDQYYRTTTWQKHRRARLLFDNYQCCWCGNHDRSQLHVHHFRYELFLEARQDLMTLCADCHTRMHELVTCNAFPSHVTQDVAERIRAEFQEWSSSKRPTDRTLF